MPPQTNAVASRWRSCALFAAFGAVYLAACRIMLAPIVNFAQLRTASFEGDARAFIWVLAWDNHAVLDHVPSLFDANKLFPLPNALAYGEHLFGISLFTLPLYAATRNPVLAYNIVWILAYVLTAVAVHVLAWRYTRDHLAAMTAAMSYTFCFFRMHHGHGHLNLIWSFWIPLSFIAMERWTARPTWTRLSGWTAVIVLQALASWYQAVLIAVADAVFFVWLFAVERRTMRLSRFVLHGSVSALVAFAVVWPFARHYFILHSEAPAYAAAASADLVGWFVPPENTWVGQWLLAHHIDGPRWIWGELTVYLGWITLGLASVGAVVSMRSQDAFVRRTRVFIVLGVVAAVLALGPSSGEVASGSFGWTPFGILAHVPGLSLFRIPARYTDSLESRPGLAGGNGLRGVASAIRPGGTSADDCVDAVAAARSLCRQVPRWRAAAVPCTGRVSVHRDALARRRAVAAGLREDAAVVPGSQLSVLLDGALASDRQRGLTRMAAAVRRPGRAPEDVSGRGRGIDDARGGRRVHRAACRPARSRGPARTSPGQQRLSAAGEIRA